MIHLWLLFEKFDPSPLCVYHIGYGLGQKPLFETDFELWPKISLQRNNGTISNKQSEKNSSIYKDSPPPHLVNFGPQTAKNDGRVSAHPPKICVQDELLAHICETFRFNHIRQMAHMVDADAKSLVSVGEAARRAGSRWALPRI